MNVVENRSKEVSNFIGMLRSASSCDNLSTKASRASHGDWKVSFHTARNIALFLGYRCLCEFHDELVHIKPP